MQSKKRWEAVAKVGILLNQEPRDHGGQHRSIKKTLPRHRGGGRDTGAQIDSAFHSRHAKSTPTCTGAQKSPDLVSCRAFRVYKHLIACGAIQEIENRKDPAGVSLVVAAAYRGTTRAGPYCGLVNPRAPQLLSLEDPNNLGRGGAAGVVARAVVVAG